MNHPISDIIDQLVGIDGMTTEEVEEALWTISKPLKDITLGDVIAEVKANRERRKEGNPT